MKASRENLKNKEFVPVKFTVTVETPEELNSLYAQINGSPNQSAAYNSKLPASNDYTATFFRQIEVAAQEQLERK